MEQGLIDSLWLMAGYTLWIFVIYFLINALTLRFLGTYIKVRTSMGRKTLVEVKGVTSTYFKVGFIEDGFLKYKNHEKKQKRLGVSSGQIGRKMGINFLVVDEETNSVVAPDFTVVTGFDAIKFNNLYIRTLQAPKNEKDKTKIIILLLVVIALAVLIVGYLVFQQGQLIAGMQAAVPTNTIGGV